MSLMRSTPVRVGLLEHQDGPLGQLGQATAFGTAARLVHQAGRALGLELLLPGIEGVLGDADQGGEVAGRQAAPLPGVQQQQALLGRQRTGRRLGLGGQAASLGGLLKPWNLGRTAPAFGFGRCVRLFTGNVSCAGLWTTGAWAARNRADPCSCLRRGASLGRVPGLRG